MIDHKNNASNKRDGRHIHFHSHANSKRFKRIISLSSRSLSLSFTSQHPRPIQSSPIQFSINSVADVAEWNAEECCATGNVIRGNQPSASGSHRLWPFPFKFLLRDGFDAKRKSLFFLPSFVSFRLIFPWVPHFICNVNSHQIPLVANMRKQKIKTR